MVKNLTIHGTVGRLIYGSRDVAILKKWAITKTEEDHGTWRLSAYVERLDSFQCASAARRNLLAFAAPRVGGFWYCPIVTLHLVPGAVHARCGPPEH